MSSLYAEFPESSLEEWKEKLIKDLKGTTFEQLSLLDDNGIRISPFYSSENEQQSHLKVFQNPDWVICSKFVVKNGNERDTNNKALRALNFGASALIFDFRNAGIVNFDLLLKDISLSHIHSIFQIPNDKNFLTSFQNYLKNQDLKSGEINCTLEHDPIGQYLMNKEQVFDPISYGEFIKQSTDFWNITVDTTIYQNAGANSIRQLAYGVAQLNEYLHVLSEQGHSLKKLKINFKVASGTGFFEEISKFRALRIMVANVLKSYDAIADVFLSAETSNLYRSNLDSYNNILRDSIAGMACVLGGCDALYIHGFNENTHGATDFNERMARNQQIIFKEESYLDKVADISAGSFYLETLSAEIAEKAWILFQNIEKEGGLLQYFEIGKLQKDIENQAVKLVDEYKNGKRVLIGVNKHINTAEKEIPNFLEKPIMMGIQTLNIAFAIQENN